MYSNIRQYDIWALYYLPLPCRAPCLYPLRKQVVQSDSWWHNTTGWITSRRPSARDRWWCRQYTGVVMCRWWRVPFASALANQTARGLSTKQSECPLFATYFLYWRGTYKQDMPPAASFRPQRYLRLLLTARRRRGSVEEQPDDDIIGNARPGCAGEASEAVKRLQISRPITADR